jgi:hypothetical protein
MVFDEEGGKMIAINPFALRTELLESIRTNSHAVEQQHDPDDIELIDSATFAALDDKPQWLVEGALVAGQLAIIGGLAKTCKTSIAVALAIAIATGKLFLGSLRVPTRQRVGIISAESGRAVLQETARRICGSQGLTLASANVYWGFRLPRLEGPAQLARIAALIRRHALKVLVIDPAYLAFPAYDSISPGNVFQMGQLIARLAETCLSEGCTPIIVHHFPKGVYRAQTSGRNKKNWDPPELFDFAQAGFTEIARQWMLIGRREPYDHENGLHRLWLNVGGSVGFSRVWGVDIHEGRLGTDFGGRTWAVTVRTQAQLITVEKAEKLVQAVTGQNEKLKADCLTIRESLRKASAGQTRSGLRKQGGLSMERIDQALARLKGMKWVEDAHVQQRAGNAGKRSYPGHRLTKQGRTQQWPAA